MKRNILYVHGYKSNGNSNTFRNLKTLLPECNIFSDSFELLDMNATVNKITNLIKEHNINMLVGSSLGGFHTLAYTEIPVQKIVINPCMYPSIEIPKIDPSLPNGSMDLLKEYEKFVNSDKSDEIRQNIFGIFGLQDELFHYGPNFNNFYGNQNNQVYIDGMHRLTIEQLINGIKPACQYFGE